MAKKLETWHNGSLKIPAYLPAHKGRPVAVPKVLGEAVDLVVELDELKKQIEAQAKLVAAAKQELEGHLLGHMNNANLEALRGQRAQVSIQEHIDAEIEDYEEFCAFVHKRKAYHLFQKRLSITAIRELWSEKKVVEGIKPRRRVALHLTKLKAKGG